MATAKLVYVCAALVAAILFILSAGVDARRSRARTNDSRLTYKKEGQCPHVEVVNRLTNTVCGDSDCEHDVECAGAQKCCMNTCGGKSCVIPPVQMVTEGTVTEPSVISELDDQSGLLTVNEGETAVLYCNASSRIPTSYGWILVQPGPSLPVVDVFPPGSTIGNKRVSSDGRRLTVAGARVQDTANYACVAASLLGYVTKSYQLYVHASDAAHARPPAGVDDVQDDVHHTEDATTNPRDVENWPELVSPFLDELSQRLTTTRPHPPSPMTTMASSVAPVIAEDGTNTVCYQPRDKGMCNREEQRWFYNTSKGKCEQFAYSGCNGNLNNFRTYEECNLTCPQLSENPCEQPIFTGPCRARFMRWGYDSGSGQCVKFVYGGCRANGNNFQRRELCTAKCIQPVVAYSAYQPSSSRIADCRCVKPRLKNCFCSSEFAIEGTVLQKHNSQRGDILVIEVENVFKQGTLSLRKARSMSNNVTIIRDMSQIGRSCNCHTLEANSVSYIIMGHVNTRGDAEIDSNSYVSEATPRRANKLESQNMKPQSCRQSSRLRLADGTAPRGRAGGSSSRS